MDLELEGNAALTIASTSGLGFASATALAREGANVAVCGRSADALEEAREQLDAAGAGSALAVQADVTDPDEVEAYVEEVADTFGGIDHVVMSAGGPPSGPFLETTERDWYVAYDLLVMSAVWTTRAAHPSLRESDAGSIVAITSRTVKEVSDNLVLSNAVRRAVIGLVKTQAREFAPEIRANAVLPGAHETARLRELMEDAVERGDYPDMETARREWSDAPLGRPADPIELGEVVAFLSSPRASYVNGAAIPIDGGATRS
jgi:glucose 1-dehydrogenase/3-oxoacyl-[acyl-carrier protein] reductase